jgi:CheY-like chemotaxis protein/anti-sigma regulatory factor (Ser/Thr protein kinase)
MTTILVVDDSEVDRRVVGGLLAKESSWDVDFAEDGAAAMDKIRAFPPDLVITDLKMPVMNGLELVAAIRRDYPLTPVILITSQGSDEIAIQALKLGAASYSPKAALAKDLIETVRSVLSVSSERRTNARLLERLVGKSLRFVIENDSSLIPPLVGYLQDQLLPELWFDESDRIRVGVAMEEALVNALYHGNLEISSQLKEEDDERFYSLARKRRFEAPYAERRIQVDATQNGTEVRVVIRDEGPGFDPRCLPDPTDPQNLERPCGRGLLLIRTFMDEVDHNERGNEITMIKRAGSSDDDD